MLVVAAVAVTVEQQVMAETVAAVPAMQVLQMVKQVQLI
tara:strand:+ start:238 stop:354 length:117 start_codon:yes stop_codon:yes gene_type:complete